MLTAEPALAGVEVVGQSVRAGDPTEEEFLAVITPLLPRGPQTPVGTGDDCVVLSSPDSRTAVNTDVLVEGCHFRIQWSAGRDVGARAAVQNPADTAAMGARPAVLVVGLIMSTSAPVDWVRDFARGLAQGCEPCGAGVVSGDLSGGDLLVVSVMVLGDLEYRAPVLRSEARPGDAVMHVGTLGRSAAGLAPFSAGSSCAPGSGAVVPSSQEHPQTRACIEAFRAPAPSLTTGRDLALAGATSMLDVSDGLLRDAGWIARASDAIIDLDDPGDLPGTSFLEPVAALVSGRDGSVVHALARSWLLTGGEDHGLFAIVPAYALDRLPAGVRVIGRVLNLQSSPARVLGYRPGVLLAGKPAQERTGWGHFSHAWRGVTR